MTGIVELVGRFFFFFLASSSSVLLTTLGSDAVSSEPSFVGETLRSVFRETGVNNALDVFGSIVVKICNPSASLESSRLLVSGSIRVRLRGFESKIL